MASTPSIVQTHVDLNHFVLPQWLVGRNEFNGRDSHFVNAISDPSPFPPQPLHFPWIIREIVVKKFDTLPQFQPSYTYSLLTFSLPTISRGYI